MTVEGLVAAATKVNVPKEVSAKFKAAVDADELVAAIQRERFARTNRFMLALPRALGRVRLTAVETDTLSEHVRAWCASR